jgi:hypothetical protein
LLFDYSNFAGCILYVYRFDLCWYMSCATCILYDVDMYLYMLKRGPQCELVLTNLCNPVWIKEIIMHPLPISVVNTLHEDRWLLNVNIGYSITLYIKIKLGLMTQHIEWRNGVRKHELIDLQCIHYQSMNHKLITFNQYKQFAHSCV